MWSDAPPEAPPPALLPPFAWSFPLTLFIPGIPPGTFIGNVLGDKALTGAPRDDALMPPLMVGSYFVFVGSFVLDARSLVAIGLSGSGISDGLVVVNPS